MSEIGRYIPGIKCVHKLTHSVLYKVDWYVGAKYYDISCYCYHTVTCMLSK